MPGDPDAVCRRHIVLVGNVHAGLPRDLQQYRRAVHHALAGIQHAADDGVIERKHPVISGTRSFRHYVPVFIDGPAGAILRRDVKCDQLPHLHHGHKPVLQQETVGQHAQVRGIAQGHAGGLPGHQGRILPVQLFLKFRQDLPGVRHHLGGAGIARAQILHQPNGGVILPALAQGALQGEAQPQGCAQQRHQQGHQQQKCHRSPAGAQGVLNAVSGKHTAFPPLISVM